MSSGSPRRLNGFLMGSLHISLTFLRIREDGTLSPALNDSLTGIMVSIRAWNGLVGRASEAASLKAV
ncbi:hypothetical protein N7481_010781 [Penicillium waksmanii]|uniref:uncharacterized protein n=1 Tax=Penicillium waksmanii TaxID=69791 RepID=UPI002548484B|nr:uncharacterized protein N7481_010781 [Penicillium waksmanii]KAJ5973571.1 hypothetical protein N7481_010781 [Penicillium waksmanii]